MRAPQASGCFGVRIAVAKALRTLISRRIRYGQFIEPPRNSPLTQPVPDKPREDIPHDLRRLLIRKQRVFVPRVFFIAVGRESADKLAVFTFVTKGAPHIAGGLIGILLVQKARDADFQAVHHLRIKKGVEFRLIQRDKTRMIQRNELLQEPALIRAVAERAGKIFDDDTVDASASDIPHHTLKVLALQIRCTAGPIVHIGAHNLVQAVRKKSRQLVRQNLLLIDNRLGHRAAVFAGEPNVFADPPFDRRGLQSALDGFSDSRHPESPPVQKKE